MAKNGESIHDPFLTEEGEEQGRTLCKNFSYHDDVSANTVTFKQLEEEALRQPTRSTS